MLKLPRPVSLLILNGMIGFVLSAAFMLGLLWLNPGGVATVLFGAVGHPWPLVLLWFFCGLTFGGAQSAIAFMAEGEDRPR